MKDRSMKPTKSSSKIRTCSRAAGSLALSLALFAGACGGDSDGDRARGNTGASDQRTSLQDLGGSAVPINEGGSSSEDGKLATTGETLSLGESYRITLTESQMVNSFTFPAGSVIEAALSVPDGSQQGASISWADANNVVGGGLNANPGGTATSEDPIVTPAGEDLEVQTTLTGAVGDQVTIEFNATPQTEGANGGEGDAGENTGVASAITSGETVSGILGGNDAIDVFSISVDTGSVISIDLAKSAESGNGSTQAQLKFNGNSIGGASVQPGGEDSFQHIVSDDETGEFFIEVTGLGTYELTVSATNQNDAGSDRDAGSEVASAVEIDPGSYEGQIGDADDADLYVLEVEPGQLLSVSGSSAATGSGNTYIEGTFNGNKVLSFWFAVGGTEEGSYQFSDAETGQVALRVYNSDVDYSFDVSLGGQDDGGSGGDAGPDASKAVTVQANSTFDGVVGDADAEDWYSFTADEAGLLPVTLSRSGTDSGNLYLEASAGGATLDSTYSATGGTSEAELTVEAGQKVDLRVYNADGPYTVVVGTGENSPQPEGADTDADDTEAVDDTDDTDGEDTEAIDADEDGDDTEPNEAD